MTKQRASIFDSPEIDIAAFSPKKIEDKKAPAAEQVKAVAKAANFPSRESRPVTPKVTEKREARVYRTGRNVQFNVKASMETVQAFYAVTDANPGWVLGYTLERAIAALKRELETEA